MILRLWHGWTTIENADKYEKLLQNEIFPSIKAKNIPGYHGIQLLRRRTENETEFITLMKFESLEAVKQFAGEDYENAYVPESARNLLSRYNRKSKHYEVRENISYQDLSL